MLIDLDRSQMQLGQADRSREVVGVLETVSEHIHRAVHTQQVTDFDYWAQCLLCPGVDTHCRTQVGDLFGLGPSSPQPSYLPQRPQPFDPKVFHHGRFH